MLTILNLIFAVSFSLAQVPQCERIPLETDAPRSPGNNGFHLGIEAYPKDADEVLTGYVPGKRYTSKKMKKMKNILNFLSVLLDGFKTLYTEQTFRGYSLIAVRSNNETQEIIPIGDFKVNN